MLIQTHKRSGSQTQTSCGMCGTPFNVADKGSSIIVAYNIPFRDCASSALVATSEASTGMDRWLQLHRQQEAVVILEPDGLGIIPSISNSGTPSRAETIVSASRATAATAADDPAMIITVDALKAHSNVSVYWTVHTAHGQLIDAAHRLSQANVALGQLLLGVSNYRLDSHLKYGTGFQMCACQPSLRGQSLRLVQVILPCGRTTSARG
jgi:endoglucanase